MELEITQAKQDFAEAKAVFDRELAKPVELQSQLSPEEIGAEMEALQRARSDMVRKKKRLETLNEAAAKLNQ
jgi:hypothetical protein